MSSGVGGISSQVHPVGRNYSHSLYHILQMTHMHCLRVSAAQCVGRGFSAPLFFQFTFCIFSFFCFTNFLLTDSSESTFVTSPTIILSYPQPSLPFFYSTALQIKTVGCTDVIRTFPGEPSICSLFLFHYHVDEFMHM